MNEPKIKIAILIITPISVILSRNVVAIKAQKYTINILEQRSAKKYFLYSISDKPAAIFIENAGVKGIAKIRTKFENFISFILFIKLINLVCLYSFLYANSLILLKNQ